jgi:hypothetical protein
MASVQLRLPASLLRRFRALLSEMLVAEPQEVGGLKAQEREAVRAAHFHEGLRYAVAEAALAHPYGVVDGPPVSLVPLLTVYSVVPDAAAAFVSELAQRSDLSTEKTWHRVVLEFCEREIGPGLVATAGAEEEAA